MAVAQSKEDREKEMQSRSTNHPLQAFTPSDTETYAPLFAQTYCGFPPYPTLNQTMIYQHCGKREGAMYPVMVQAYQRNDCAYVSKSDDFHLWLLHSYLVFICFDFLLHHFEKMKLQIPSRQSQQGTYTDFVHQHVCLFYGFFYLT